MAAGDWAAAAFGGSGFVTGLGALWVARQKEHREHRAQELAEDAADAEAHLGQRSLGLDEIRVAIETYKDAITRLNAENAECRAEQAACRDENASLRRHQKAQDNRIASLESVVRRLGGHATGMESS